MTSTTLTVSHWPRTPTPLEVRADLSTESALLARARPDLLPAGTTAATADHADVDAVTALGALTVPGLADGEGDLLVEVARVGDFAVVRDRRAALVAFALHSTLQAAGAQASLGSTLVAAVARLVELVDDVDHHRELWVAEAASYDRSCAALEHGAVVVEEDAPIDLAIVRPSGEHWPEGTAWQHHPMHPAAIHGVTDRLRIATIGPDGFSLRFRYETWVRLARPPAVLRVDLTALAAALTDADDGRPWRFDGAAALRPELRYVGPGVSGLDGEQVATWCRRALAELQHAVAWDPYRT